VVEVRQTEEFDAWLVQLRDLEAKARINARIRRLALGNHGDIKPIGDGVSELRIDYGPGYRVYIAQCGKQLVILLCGGDKRRQQQDIARAVALAKQV